MNNPLLITFHDLPKNLAIEDIIKEKLKKLKVASPDITRCQVILEKLSKHHQKANSACVRLNLRVSHFDDIVISEKCQEDVASLKTAVIKTFKSGLLLMRKKVKSRNDHKRPPLREVIMTDPLVNDDGDTEEIL